MSEQSVRRRTSGHALVQTIGGLDVVVSDLEQAVVRTSELGAVVVMPPTDNGWVTEAQITDPAGNLLPLVQA